MEHTAGKHTRIILETAGDDNHWYAWRSGREDHVWDGCTAREALQSLLNTDPPPDFKIADLIEDTTVHRDGHIECVLASSASCEDCHGTGKYVGFTVVEACQTCDGTGLNLAPRIDVIKNRNVYRLLFKRFFEKQMSYAVRTFSGVQSYLSQVAVEPDCIICGMEVPDGGPVEVLNRLAEMDITSPVIVSTISPGYEDDLLQLGAFAVLPVRLFGREEYIETVKRAITSRRAKQTSGQ